ncbi:MAG: uroporphyrinogen-III synthase [Vicinamibacteria bacterium]
MTGRLAGWRVLVTRQPEQARGLADALAEEGALVVEVPLIETASPEDPSALAAAVAALDAYDWIVFTSANAVRALADACDRSARARVLPPALRIAAVGPSTAEAVGRAFAGAAVLLQPESDFRAEGLADAFRAFPIRGRRIVLPSSVRARDTLAEALRAQGASVTVVTAYRTVTPADAGARIRAALADGIDVVTFASPSAVDGFAETCPDRRTWPPAAVIGPVTEAAARERGFEVRAVADAAGARGLAEALSRLTRPR